MTNRCLVRELGLPISKIKPLRSLTSNLVGGVVGSKRGETQWVEETEPSLVLYARPLAWFRRNAPTSVVTCVAAAWSRLGECNERTFAPAASQ